ncbi:hypothetical protein [Reyranella sp. CPCC 100927]|uniref:hypothetical protein n=1 Tax=Reyranella sp. CPCC 100927 TaxID=2599616 RepID=UPI0015B56475|nr:hypothetical protein [Reyranella sp. CPCC 100927]
MKRPLHAPRIGPGFSAGAKPPHVTKGCGPHPKASSGHKSGTRRAGDKHTATSSK